MIWHILAKDKDNARNSIALQSDFVPFVVAKIQAMSCEGACAHAHVRCAVARVRVRAKRLLKHVCDVRACGHF